MHTFHNLCFGSAGGVSQIIVMPAAGVPPKLMDVLIVAYVRNVLGALSVEHPPCRAATGLWSRGNGGQIVVMPAPVVPPVLVDISNRVYNVHVLRALAGECVSNRAAGPSDEDTSSTFQFDMMPAAIVAIVAPKLVEKLAKIDHMLRAKEHVTNRCIATFRGSPRCDGEVLVMPAARVPPKLMDVLIGACVRNMPGAVSIESVSSGIGERLRSAS